MKAIDATAWVASESNLNLPVTGYGKVEACQLARLEVRPVEREAQKQ
ncbi:hypothetical protein [Paraburkholderia lycopersici]|nr:hypothetical protein [Paraburkholderia lycopersici]